MTHPHGPRCAHEQPCVRPECLKEFLDWSIRVVLTSLQRCRHIPREIAEQACSEAWWEGIDWITSGRAREMSSAKLQRWLYVAARNKAYDLLRRNRRGVIGRAQPLNPEYDPAASGILIDPFQEEEKAILAAEQRKSAQHAVLRARRDELDADDRAILDLRFEDGFTCAEIASLLKTSRPTAHRRIQEAVGRLRVLMT